MIWGTMIRISSAQMLILTNKNGETNQNSDLSTNLQIYPRRFISKEVVQNPQAWPEAVSPSHAVGSGSEIHGLPQPKGSTSYSQLTTIFA